VPNVIIIAGPNGAGKTTAAPFLLQRAWGVTEFVNADFIAQGISVFNPGAAAMDAGRVVAATLYEPFFTAFMASGKASAQSNGLMRFISSGLEISLPVK